MSELSLRNLKKLNDDLERMERYANYKKVGYEPKCKVIDTLLMSRLQNPNRRLPFNCTNRRAAPHSIEA